MYSTRNSLTLKSRVKSSLIHRQLKQGSYLAAFGACLLLLSGIFIKPSILSTWGLPLLGISFTAIAAGLLPYRKLDHLVTHPYVVFCDDEALTFFKKSRPIFSIPKKEIKGIDCITHNKIYGISLTLSGDSKENIKKNSTSLTWLEKTETWQRSIQTDLFLPFFTEKSFLSLKDWLSQKEPKGQIESGHAS